MKNPRTIIAYPAFKNEKTNPYQALLYREMEHLGWRVYDLDVGLHKGVVPDVLHLHWPDGFSFHRGLAKSVIRTGLLLGIIGYYKTLGAKVVWTIHNLQSHEQYHPRLERWFWKLFYRLIDGYVALNHTTVAWVEKKPGLAGKPGVVARIGMYPSLDTTGFTKTASVGTRYLCIGKVRTYKKFDKLIEAWTNLDRGSDGSELVIVGECSDDDYGRLLIDLAQQAHGVRVELGHLEEVDLARWMHWSDVVVIPYGQSLNSAVVFLGLAYARRVLVRRNESMQEVADAFPGRVWAFDRLEDALMVDVNEDVEWEGQVDGAREFEWPVVAQRHAEFFAALV